MEQKSLAEQFHYFSITGYIEKESLDLLSNNETVIRFSKFTRIFLD